MLYSNNHIFGDVCCMKSFTTQSALYTKFLYFLFQVRVKRELAWFSDTKKDWKMEIQVSPSPSPVLKREQNWGWTRTDPKVSILVNHIIRSLLNIQRNFFDSTMDKMKCFILFQSAVVYIVMSIKAHIPLLGSSKQI